MAKIDNIIKAFTHYSYFLNAVGRRKYMLKLKASLKTQRESYVPPIEVQIGISNKCNYRCIMCWDHPTFVNANDPYTDEIDKSYYIKDTDIDRDMSIMDLDLFRAIISDLSTMGTKKISIIGRGEPFLNNNVLEMIEYIKRMKMIAHLHTNGSLLKKDLIEELIKLNLDELNISLDSGNPDVYMKIHQYPSIETFDNIKENVKFLIERKNFLNRKFPIVSFSFVISSINLSDLIPFIDTSIECKIDRVDFNKVSVYDADKFLLLSSVQNEKLKEDIIRGEEKLRNAGILTTSIQAFIKWDKNFISSRYRSEGFYDNVPCYVGWRFCIILADGTLNPCCEGLRKIGNLNEINFKELWNSEEYQNFRYESINLPRFKKNVKGCRCDNCGYAKINFDIHNELKNFRIL